MAGSKEQERAELHRTIWGIANDLTSGLPAEIAARKKQYEYYRDKLLNFPPSPGLRRTGKQEEAA